MLENFPKPVVVVSKCLGFDSCRYNGEIIDAPFVDKLRSHVTFVPVCPEVEIGLGVPRKPIRIVSDKRHHYPVSASHREGLYRDDAELCR